MKVRLLILIVVAGGLAVYFAVGKNREPVVIEVQSPEETMSPEEEERVREIQKTLCERPLPGREPDEDAELAVTVDVDHASGKNRLYFNITEAHGYYVEELRVNVWYKSAGVTGFDNAAMRFELFLNQYVKANETLRTCAEVVPAELNRVGGDMGTADKWGAEVTYYCRAREKNPDPLPPLANVSTCN